MHLGMDPDMNILSVEMTDIEMQDSLIPNNIEIDKVIADGCY
jgi:hypothetical protein